MKRLALVAAVLFAVACTAKDDATTDTAAPAMAPAPATIDTGMRMDTMATDTTTRDTTP